MKTIHQIYIIILLFVLMVFAINTCIDIVTSETVFEFDTTYTNILPVGPGDSGAPAGKFLLGYNAVPNESKFQYAFYNSDRVLITLNADDVEVIVTNEVTPVLIETFQVSGIKYRSISYSDIDFGDPIIISRILVIPENYAYMYRNIS